MRSLVGGLRVVQRAPNAIVPGVVEGVVVGLLMVVRILPSDGSAASATAVFPFDVYFDLKAALTERASWWSFLATMAAAIALRSAMLSLSLWLADGAPPSYGRRWLATARLAAAAAAALVVPAGLMFVGVAIRYAPFVWIGGIVGFFASLAFVRRALRLDVGAGAPAGRGVPEVGTYLSYAYLVAVIAAVMSVLSSINLLLAALVAVCSAPLHALFLLGWREHVREATHPAGGGLSTVLTSFVVVALLALSTYDRYVRNPPPVGRARSAGTLLLLGGVDSSSKTGALSELDPRDLGFAEPRTTLLSYRGAGTSYRARDTHGDLDDIARRVAGQVGTARPPRFLVGHSQAALVVDRMIAARLALPERSAMLSAPPPRPPSVDVPPPGVEKPGKPAADLARAFAGGLRGVGLQGFDIDAEASPAQLRAVIAPDTAMPRLAIWPLADSVWLDTDWRRPGEINLVAFTDHVGVANNARAVAAINDFFFGRGLEGDETSWRGFLVAALRYVFEPWKP